MLLTKSKSLRLLSGVLETGNVLFLKLLLRNPAAARRYAGDVFRTYMALARHDRWACTSIFDVLPPASGPIRFTVEHLPCNVIETRLEQLGCLALLTAACHPRAIFEIGTFRGRTALNFALNAPDDCIIYTLDLPPDDRSRARATTNAADAQIIEQSVTGCEYRGKDVEGKIRQIFGDSQCFDFSPFTGAIDIVYIDGAHHYDAVRHDTENALRMVKPGGYVLWDEFANYGDYNDVTRAVLDSVPIDEISHIEHTQLAVYRKPL